MPTVVELSDPYANFLRHPLEPGTPGVCAVCLTLIEDQYSNYRRCVEDGRVTLGGCWAPCAGPGCGLAGIIGK